MTQYNWKYRRYEGNGIRSNNFSDVVGDNVSVSITRDMYYPHTKQDTPFMGVRLRPYNAPAHLLDLITNLEPRRKRIHSIFNTIKNIIYRNWMPDKIHVIGASSGYDSRIIAKAIQSLYQKHGRDWLGETYFVECGGESEGFLPIMKKLGFEKRAIVWKPEFTFDFFSHLHNRFNGLCAYPFNQWYDFYIRNWKEDDLQYISGYGGNVADAMSPYSKFMHPIKHKMTIKQKLIYYFKEQYYYQVSAFRELKYSLHPFWNYDYIDSVSDFWPQCTRTAEYLAYHLVPECRDIKRMRILYEVTRNGHRRVNDKELNKMFDWFKSTDYGKQVKTKPRSTVEYNQWWLHYCIAWFLNDNGYGKDNTRLR